MIKKIVLSKHAQLKIKERRLDVDTIKRVIEEPASLFFDILSKTMAAIRKVEISGIETNLVVVFTHQAEEVKVITAYPCRNIDREIKAKEGKRWLKIK